MAYKVLLTEEAEADIENAVSYMAYALQNLQESDAFLVDFDEAVEALSLDAISRPFCENPKLRKMGYRKIHFRRQRFFALYRVSATNVIIDRIFHDLQDCESKLK